MAWSAKIKLMTHVPCALHRSSLADKKVLKSQVKGSKRELLLKRFESCGWQQVAALAGSRFDPGYKYLSPVHQRHQCPGSWSSQANYPQTKNRPLRTQITSKVLGLRCIHPPACLGTLYVVRVFRVGSGSVIESQVEEVSDRNSPTVIHRHNLSQNSFYFPHHSFHHSVPHLLKYGHSPLLQTNTLIRNATHLLPIRLSPHLLPSSPLKEITKTRQIIRLPHTRIPRYLPPIMEDERIQVLRYPQPLSHTRPWTLLTHRKGRRGGEA